MIDHTWHHRPDKSFPERFHAPQWLFPPVYLQALRGHRYFASKLFLKSLEVKKVIIWFPFSSTSYRCQFTFLVEEGKKFMSVCRAQPLGENWADQSVKWHWIPLEICAFKNSFGIWQILDFSNLIVKAKGWRSKVWDASWSWYTCSAHNNNIFEITIS